MAKVKHYKHSHLDIVNVKWDHTPNPDIVRLWAKPHLIGVVNTTTGCWIANDLINKVHKEGRSKTWERAKANVVAFLIECSHNA